MKKLYTAILTITALTMASQLIAGPFVPDEEPLPAPVVPVPAPAPAPVLPALDANGVLDLSDRGLGDAGIIAIAPHFSAEMREIWLNGNDIGPAGAQAIANNLNRAQGLVHIELGGNHIGGEGARALVQQLPNGFETIFLPGNNLGDAEVEALAQLPLPPSLGMLVLSHNNIGNVGIIALAHSLQQNPIANQSVLQFAGNEFGDEGRQALNAAGYEEMGGVGVWMRNVPAGLAGAGH